MAVAIRLYRVGKKNNPAYRIVVTDKRNKRDGAYIEAIGFYNPMTNPHLFELDRDRFNYWKNQGATISHGLNKLLSHFKKD